MTELTEQDVALLRQLIHVAVQSKGMEVAEAAVYLNRKLETLLKQPAIPRSSMPPPKIVKDQPLPSNELSK